MSSKYNQRKAVSVIKVQNKKLVPALGRGVRLLDFVATSSSKPTLTELASAVDLPKSTVHGLCSTLTELGLLRRNSDGTFQIGPHVMQWANSFTRETSVVREFAQIWDAESFLPGATVTLSVLEGAEIVYVAARNSGTIAGFNFRIGMRLPAVFTATGKAFLSYLTEPEIRALYPEGLPSPMTPFSVSNVSDLMRQLRSVQQQGYSVDNQEVAEGMACIGAPVLNAQNQPIAAIAVSLLANTLSKEELDEVAASVREIARSLSVKLGALA
ncbi:IclR family transcriptional regulator [Celeribacter sp.]|uniref:IclR family transcriptional regulator n=1 Tax=Celeribacter sp. TaxID=1890673 RepID=UPI003A92524F